MFNKKIDNTVICEKNKLDMIFKDITKFNSLNLPNFTNFKQNNLKKYNIKKKC